MWEINKSASHGGNSIRRIFIFALVTIVTSFLYVFTTPINTSAIVPVPTNQNQTVNNPAPADTNPDETALETVDAAKTEKASSCAIEGVGWIVCPITKALAGGMDWVYGVLCSMMEVQPVANDNEGALFKAWAYMRSFANVAFVIAFLIIIYSQMTNYGINNYGIKKLLPRLIIAAILVNVSYYICAVAVDISNILGYSIQDSLMSLRAGLMGPDVNNIVVPTWESVTALVLGGVGAGVGVWAAISTFEVAGAALLLVPAVLACLLAVLVAFVVLTARQAIITILIIIAPLAFVAYLLPNTEKWFEKWKSTFLTLLILFPAFSVVFGGAQLASIAIIKNANSIQVVIMGLMVQIAPLMITPLLVKFGGTLLNKVGGFVNNPAKGIIDRANNLAKDSRDTRAAKTLANKSGAANLPLRARQKLDYDRRKREADRKTYGNTVGNRFERDYADNVRKSPDRLRRHLEASSTGDQAAASKARLETIQEELRAGKHTFDLGRDRNKNMITVNLSDLAEKSEYATKEIALSGIAAQIAKRQQQDNVAKILMENNKTEFAINDMSAREFAAGIKVAEKDGGQYTALATAISSKRDADNKLINERAQLIKYFNVSGGDEQRLIMGEDVTVTKEGTGEQFTFKTMDEYTIEAAIEDKLKKSAYGEIIQIMAASGGKLSKHSATIGNAIPANGLAAKIPYLAGRTIGDISQGRISSEEGLRNAARNYFIEGRFGTEVLAGAEPDAIRDIANAAQYVIQNPHEFIDADPNKGRTTITGVKAITKKSLDALLSDSDVILDTNKTAGRGATRATRTSLENLVSDLKDTNI